MDLGEKIEGVTKVSGENEYAAEGAGRQPILTKLRITQKSWVKGKLVSEEETDVKFDSRERPSIPESEFTLSAYGLPEPHWVRPKKTMWYLWLGVAGVVCLALAIGVHLLKRRVAGSS